MPRRRIARSFFDRKGRARGAGEVYALLAASHGTQAAASAAPAFAPDQPFAFARNAGGDSEFAGACFAPDGKTFFVNIQDPGLTFAITGPFRA